MSAQSLFYDLDEAAHDAGKPVTYEYQCKVCKHRWEAEQRITAEPLTECPSCEQPQAQRLVSGGTGFVLDGKGWAKDGYGS